MLFMFLFTSLSLQLCCLHFCKKKKKLKNVIQNYVCVLVLKKCMNLINLNEPVIGKPQWHSAFNHSPLSPFAID